MMPNGQNIILMIRIGMKYVCLHRGKMKDIIIIMVMHGIELNLNFPSDIKNGSIYLILGHIDDVDEVYLNGKLVGSTGSFPPNYQTAYNANRKYPVPLNNFFTDKENVLAVKVYDSRLNGGIVSGDISIMMLETLNLEVNLEGFWKFKLGDDLYLERIRI